MSRAWMPWYIGDYLSKTGHLTTEQHGAYLLLIAHCWQHGKIPTDDRACAAIARMTPAKYKSAKKTLGDFFKPDGTHNRVTEELEKAEAVIIKRKIAGSRGGMHSAIARAAAKQTVSKRQAIAQPIATGLVQQNPSNRADNHNHKETTSTEQASEGGETNTATSLATALPAGALARPPEAEQISRKRPADVSKEELEAMYAARREAKLQHTGH